MIGGLVFWIRRRYLALEAREAAAPARAPQNS
jgi:hypothetical protein